MKTATSTEVKSICVSNLRHSFNDLSIFFKSIILQVVTLPSACCGCVVVKSGYTRWMLLFLLITHSFDFDFIDEVTACILKLINE